MKIVVLDGYTLNPGDLTWERLDSFGEVTVYDRTAPELVIERIGDAEIIFTNKTGLTKEIFTACPQIKFIGVLATGYNVVDTEAAKEADILVCNVPTYGTTAVAQFAFALILELCHHVGDHSDSVAKGDWSSAPDFCYWKSPLVELADKTIGIIGFGRIGQQTAKVALGFGMKVLAYDAIPNKSLERESIKIVELDELYAKADIISLHCPLFPSTEGMINQSSIAKMKTGVKIINTSRGPLIVEKDLVDALESGKVSAAALDVLSSEPAKSDNPLVGAKNCIVTPHIAWAPKESRERLLNIAIDNLEAYISENPINVVNK
jgi:glycerate dehydrogenase